MRKEPVEHDDLCPLMQRQIALFEYAVYRGEWRKWIPMPEHDKAPNAAREGESFVLTPEESEFMIVLAQGFAGELRAAVQGAQEGFVKDDAIVAFLYDYRPVMA